jgi:hypothetical protein
MIPFVSDPFLAGIIRGGSFILKGGVGLIAALGMKSLKLETVTDEVSTHTTPDSLKRPPLTRACLAMGYCREEEWR